MRLVLLGPPGAGKGTQSDVLKEKLGHGVLHHSVGDILRDAVKKNTPLGKQAEPFMSSGKLVPDNIILGVIRERFMEKNFQPCFLMDGFPRTIPQAEAFDSILKELRLPLTGVIVLDIPLSAIIERLVQRRSCPVCHRVYHLKYQKPKHDEMCDEGHGALIQRPDDSAEIIRQRFAVYEKETLPVIQYYQKKNLLIPVVATESIDNVSKDLLAKIDLFKKEHVL